MTERASDVLVTGASGVLGRAVVAELARRGRLPRAMSRRHVDVPRGVHTVYGDVHTGEGLGGAVAGVGAIVHCATDPVRHRAVDVDGTRRLIDAARSAGSPHLLYVSIVGVDRIPYRYYRAKLEVERMVEESGLPWTVLRATQFHDLVLTLAQQFTRPPLVVVPKVRVQPVDVRDVAERIAELVLAGPAERAPDLGGPADYRAEALVRRYLAHVRVRRRVIEVRQPGAVWGAFQAGANLVPGESRGRRGFGAYLAEQSVFSGDAVYVRSPYADRWSGAVG